MQKYCIHEERRQDFYYFCLIIVDVILIFYYAQGGYFDEFVNKNSDRSWSWYHCRSGTGCGRCRFRQNMDRTFWYYLYEYDQNDHRSFGLLVSRHWCLQFGGYQKDRPYRRQNYGLLFGNYGICDCTWYIFRYGFRTGRRREYAW